MCRVAPHDLHQDRPTRTIDRFGALVRVPSLRFHRPLICSMTLVRALFSCPVAQVPNVSYSNQPLVAILLDPLLPPTDPLELSLHVDRLRWNVIGLS